MATGDSLCDPIASGRKREYEFILVRSLKLESAKELLFWPNALFLPYCFSILSTNRRAVRTIVEGTIHEH